MCWYMFTRLCESTQTGDGLEDAKQYSGTSRFLLVGFMYILEMGFQECSGLFLRKLKILKIRWW